jgi:RNA polymerase sigma factor (sigma-70 family)
LIDTNNISDQELLNQYYKDGNGKWLGFLFQRYTLLLLGVCMKYLKNEEEAKDAVQQVFEKCIRELDKYPVHYFKSWIYSVAKNHCLIQLRNKGKLPGELQENMLLEDESDEHYERILEKNELLNHLEQCLPLLNPEQRTCIEAFYLNKMSYREIAESTGLTMMQIKSNIQNGKRNLKQLLLQFKRNER